MSINSVLTSISNTFGFRASDASSAASSHYPKYISELFSKHHFSGKDLSVLDLNTGYNGSTDYMDHFDSEKMISPVMLFKDAWNRPGIALHVKGRSTSQRTYTILDLPPIPASKMEGVFAIFLRRAPPKASPWVLGGGSRGMIESVYRERHEENGHTGGIMECPTCPFKGSREPVSSQVLSDLFNGTDPDFQLGNDPEFKLFPEIIPEVKTSNPVYEAISTVCKSIYSVFASLYTSLCSCFSSKPSSS